MTTEGQPVTGINVQPLRHRDGQPAYDRIIQYADGTRSETGPFDSVEEAVMDFARAAGLAQGRAGGLDVERLRAKARNVVGGHTPDDAGKACRECAMLWPCHARILADDILLEAPR